MDKSNKSLLRTRVQVTLFCGFIGIIINKWLRRSGYGTILPACWSAVVVWTSWRDWLGNVHMYCRPASESEDRGTRKRNLGSPKRKLKVHIRGIPTPQSRHPYLACGDRYCMCMYICPWTWARAQQPIVRLDPRGRVDGSRPGFVPQGTAVTIQVTEGKGNCASMYGT